MRISTSQAFFVYTALLKILDALTVLGVWYWCWYLRFQSALIPVTKGLPPFGGYSKIVFPLLAVFTAVFHIIGAYRRDRLFFGFKSLKKVIEGSILGTLVFISICYFIRELHFSRVFLALFPAVAIAGLFIERSLLHILWEIVQTKWINPTRILLVGGGEPLALYVNRIKERQPYPVTWIGRLGASDDITLSDIKYLGSEEELQKILSNRSVDTVVVSYASSQSETAQKILELLSEELVTIKLLPDFGKYNTFTYTADQECGVPLLTFNQVPGGTTDRFLKRLFDLVGSLLFLIFFFPLFLFISILIKLTSRGPIIYSQTRLGADGRVFTFYKFRSMRVDAERETGAVWAKENDPRTTAVGKWLRRTSLDELPQFYNVLKGDMSLVGPRPERPIFVNQFRQEIPKYMLRHKMKSGLTGWAQINGWRGNTSLDERIKYDLFYIGHWSHFFDFKILCLTLWKGFVHRHAY